tara:strand:+ start:9551 stop:9982 length:432 start_codon:yes stop_codon:yes gene_type:complete
MNDKEFVRRLCSVLATLDIYRPDKEYLKIVQIVRGCATKGKRDYMPVIEKYLFNSMRAAELFLKQKNGHFRIVTDDIYINTILNPEFKRMARKHMSKEAEAELRTEWASLEGNMVGDMFADMESRGRQHQIMMTLTGKIKQDG